MEAVIWLTRPPNPSPFHPASFFRTYSQLFPSFVCHLIIIVLVEIHQVSREYDRTKSKRRPRKFDKLLSTNRASCATSHQLVHFRLVKLKNWKERNALIWNNSYEEWEQREMMQRWPRTTRVHHGSSLPLAANFSPLREYSRSRKQRGSLVPVIIGVALENSEWFTSRRDPSLS